MTVKPAKVLPTTVTPEKTATAPEPATAAPQPALPTFDLDVGWKYVYNAETDSYDQVPLTLLDVLYPQEDEPIVMPESPDHDLWCRWLAAMLHNFLAPQGWLVISDVIIHWGYRGVPGKAPDVAAIPGGQRPKTPAKSYRVSQHGPLPVFVLEITSEGTRVLDLEAKKYHYAAVGVRELLIVDFWPEEGEDWRLLGYRLGDSPYYEALAPDSEGGLTFETIGLRFVAVDQERIEIYNAATGERLLPPDELQAYAEAQAEARAKAEARAEAEAEARAEAERRLQEMEAELARLREGKNQ